MFPLPIDVEYLWEKAQEQPNIHLDPPLMFFHDFSLSDDALYVFANEKIQNEVTSMSSDAFFRAALLEKRSDNTKLYILPVYHKAFDHAFTSIIGH